MTLMRALNLGFLIIRKKSQVINIKFGSAVFKFNYRHGERHQGGRGIFLYREKIESLMEYGDRFMRFGGTCIDGGANQGIFTIAFSNYVGLKGKVVAIEPMPYACAMIKDNLELNELENTIVYEGALSDAPGEAMLDFSTGVGSASIVKDFGGEKLQHVRTYTIDEIVELESIEHVDFIKLDIEGAELKGLIGAQDTLTNFGPVVCLEVNSVVEGGQDLEAHNYMLSNGYTPYIFDSNKLIEPRPFKPPYINVFYHKR